MAEAATPATMKRREFARHLGCKPGYVTQLDREGRLVLTEDGRHVRVAESIRLIADTRDPSRQGVRDRHAVARKNVEVPSSPSNGNSDAGSELDDLPANPHASRRAKALADKEEALARKALREEQIELGQLLPTEQVRSALADAVTGLRSRLEMLPATMTPTLAANTDEGEVKVLLRDAIEQALHELEQKFGRIAKGSHGDAA